ADPPRVRAAAAANGEDTWHRHSSFRRHHGIQSSHRTCHTALRPHHVSSLPHGQHYLAGVLALPVADIPDDAVPVCLVLDLSAAHDLVAKPSDADQIKASFPLSGHWHPQLARLGPGANPLSFFMDLHNFARDPRLNNVAFSAPFFARGSSRAKRPTS